MPASLPDRLQPLIRSASSRLPFGIQRRLFGNAMLDRLRNLRALGFDPRHIVDIGAYVGRWTESVLPIFPAARILMVEAQEGKRAALQRVVDGSGGRASLHIALAGGEAGERTFYEMETGSSMFGELSGVARTETVRSATTIDAVIAAGGFPRADLVKLDVQGAELEVLAGGPQLLASAQVVVMEVAVRPYNAGAPLMAEVIAFMDRAGFRVFDLCEIKRASPGDLPVQLDLLFARPDGPLAAAIGAG